MEKQELSKKLETANLEIEKAEKEKDILNSQIVNEQNKNIELYEKVNNLKLNISLIKENLLLLL
jgi:hypothetical protein